MHGDYLTCGQCCAEFPLSHITAFIMHKTSCLQSHPTTTHTDAGLCCFMCQHQFHTARALVQHLHHAHSLLLLQHSSHLPPPSSLPPLTDMSPLSASPTPPSSVYITDKGAGSRVATATTVCDEHVTAMSHMANEASISSSSPSLPVTCAKLASSQGATICCNGSECKVTITPPHKTGPPKKCCSSVVPKKRTRHMQEHDHEDMEQSALEILASLHGRFLTRQNAKGQRNVKKSSKSKKCKPRSYMRCEREFVCVSKAKESESCDSESKEQTCDSSDENEEDDDKTCCDDKPQCKGGESKPKVDIYSLDREDITSRKTVIINPGMTVTLESRKPPSPQPARDKRTSSTHTATVASEDVSRESAEILAELMYHTSLPMEQLVPGSGQGLEAVISDSAVTLASLTDGMLAAPVSQQPGFLQDTLNSSLCPMFASTPLTHTTGPTSSSSLCPMFTNTAHTTGPTSSSSDSLCPMFTNTAHTTGATSSSSDSLCPMFANSSFEQTIQAGMPSTDLSPLTVASSLDMQQLSDLESLSPSIQPFPALDPMAQQGPAGITDGPMSFVTPTSQPSLDKGGGVVDEMTKTGGGKKRRYPTSRPYKCSQCDQAFNQPVHLKKHMSKHTGVKPFKCDSCDYSTVERSHLKAHKRIHTGEKPFRCEFCSYATAQNSTLRVHLRRHHRNTSTTIPPSL